MVREEPANGAERELPTRAFELFFNQAVSPESVQRVATVMLENAGESHPIEFTVDATRAGRSQADPRHAEAETSAWLARAPGAGWGASRSRGANFDGRAP